MSREPYRNHLPNLLLSAEVLPALSLDAYIYYHCGACGMHLGLNPVLIDDRAEIRRPFPCAVCGMQGHLTLHVFQVKSRLRCDDCGRTWEELHNGFFFAPACESCGSTRNTQIESEPSEPLPEVFADRTDARLWGLDAAADAKAIGDAVVRNRMVHDRVRYLVPAALFAERLFVWNDYPRDRWLLRNLQGRLLHEYFKAVRLESAGLAAAGALADLAEGDDAPHGAGGLADLCNETAYACYSLLRLAGSGMAFDLEEVRETGSRIGRKAIAAYAEVDGVDAELIGGQVGRTWFLIGDILRTHSSDVSQLNEAIACYDRAVRERHLPADVRGWVGESREKALRQIDSIRGVERAADQRAPVDYDQEDWPRLSAESRCAWYRAAAGTLESEGRLAAAEEALHRAQTAALDESRIAPDVPALRLWARIFSPIFDDVVHLNVRLGRPYDALEAVDSVRAVVLRRSYVPTEAESRELARNVVSRGLLQMLGRVDVAPRLSGLADLPTPTRRDHTPTDAALANLGRLGWPRDVAIGTFVVSAGKVSVVTARRTAGGWRVEAIQTPARVEELMRVVELLDLKPGIFRSRRLRAVCSTLSGALLDGLLPWLREWGVVRLAVSVPGYFSHVPIEALFGDGGPEIFVVPSVRAASSMAGELRAARTPGRVLAVGYDGPGLPRVAAEIDRLREVYGERLDAVSPRITKRELLARLTTTDYDIVHFACHGSFAMADESDSALHLSATDDGRTVLLKAYELSRVKFARSPVVVLSACESGLSSLGHSNNYDGLNGAFLRMGARGVVGSRWAVYDDAAFGFMDRFHTQVAAGVSAERAVAAAQADLRATHDVDDWAAFSYLGLPGLDNEEGAEPTWK